MSGHLLPASSYYFRRENTEARFGSLYGLFYIEPVYCNSDNIQAELIQMTELEVSGRCCHELCVKMRNINVWLQACKQARDHSASLPKRQGI